MKRPAWWPAGFGGDRVLLAGAAMLLLAALARPTLRIERGLFEHLVVLDVTQSMNVRDMQLDGRPVSRLEHAKASLRRALLGLPCGSKVGWAVFTEHRSYVLYTPVEVCANLDELRTTLARIDNTMAWMGGSEVAKGLYGALRVSAGLPGKPSVVFVTDGHEAPPVNPAHRPAYDGKAGDVAGVVVGVGGLMPVPIPKSDPAGRQVGWWGADEVMQTDPYRQGRGGSVGGERMVEDADAASAPLLPGATPGGEHRSALREGYLRLLARETGLAYVNVGTAPALQAAWTAPALARPVAVPFDLQPVLAGLALLLVAARHAVALRRWHGWRGRQVAAAHATRQDASDTRRLPS